jgi:D,D-heptose 1,7-bisphosphate phosphatase
VVVKQAVFLVGGKGTRLGQLTRDTPKPLLEIAPGLRFLDVVLEEAARRGFSDIVLLAGHLGDQVEAAYQGRRIHDATVRVIREPEPQGTGGALRYAADALDPWFLMSNGDSLFEFNFRDLARIPGPGILGRIALRTVPDPARYGAVTVAGGKVTRFLEKNPDLAGPAEINGGVYLLSRDVLGLIDGPCSIEQDIFPRLAAAGALEGRAYDGYFLDIGLPDTYAQAQAEIPPRRQRPAAFFDRDGTLNVDDGYTHKPGDLRWNPGAIAAIKRLNESGYYVIVVTNQAGIGRGYYDEAAMHAFHAAMQSDLAEHGAYIDYYYYCPYHPDAAIPAYRAANHPDRKPNAGMIYKAFADWPIDRANSFLIGDTDHDLAAAAAAGLPGYRYEGGDLLALVAAHIRSTGVDRDEVVD